MGQWPKDPKQREIGAYDQLAVEEGLEGRFSMRSDTSPQTSRVLIIIKGYVIYMFTDILGWSMSEVQVYLAKVRKELRDKKYHTYFWTRAVYGRKPAATET